MGIFIKKYQQQNICRVNTIKPNVWHLCCAVRDSKMCRHLPAKQTNFQLQFGDYFYSSRQNPRLDILLEKLHSNSSNTAPHTEMPWVHTNMWFRPWWFVVSTQIILFDNIWCENSQENTWKFGWNVWEIPSVALVVALCSRSLCSLCSLSLTLSLRAFRGCKFWMDYIYAQSAYMCFFSFLHHSQIRFFSPAKDDDNFCWCVRCTLWMWRILFLHLEFQQNGFTM